LAVTLYDKRAGEYYCIHPNHQPDRIKLSDSRDEVWIYVGLWESGDFWVKAINYPRWSNEASQANECQQALDVEPLVGYASSETDFTVFGDGEYTDWNAPYDLGIPWTIHESGGGEYWVPQSYDAHTSSGWRYAVDFYYSKNQIPGDRDFDPMASVDRQVLATTQGVVTDITYEMSAAECPSLGPLTAKDRAIDYGTLRVRYTHLKKLAGLDGRVVRKGETIGWIADPNSQDPEERIDLGCATTAHVHLQVQHKGALVALDDPEDVKLEGEAVLVGPRDTWDAKDWRGIVYTYGAMPRGELPDLTVSATVGSAYASGASDVPIPVTVYRTGGSLTRGTYVTARLYWSTNATWEPSVDLQRWESNGDLPDYPNNELNSQGSKTVRATVDIPALQEGSYFVLAVVDPTEFHPESDEQNNVTAFPVTLTSPIATHVAFTFQPSDVEAGRDVFPAGFRIYPAIEVEVRDAEGNRVPSYTGEVTLELGTNPGGGSCTGCGPVTPVEGVASFPDVVIDETGEGYTLVARSGELTEAESNPFDITIPGDLNLDGLVNVVDLGILLSSWGDTSYPPADINKDGIVDVVDQGILLSHWTAPAEATTEPATEVTSSSAVLHGTVNPNGLATDAWFEWGTDPTLGTFNSTTTQSIGSGTESQPVSAELTELTAGTAYYFRVAASNDGGSAEGEILSFTTEGTEFTTVSAGLSHTCGITSDGSAYCWGDNRSGKLGTGSGRVYEQRTPAPVVGGLEFVSITTGNNHTCGLTSRGAAYCWGSNVWGPLGSDSTTAECTNSQPGYDPCVSWPVPVSGGLTFESLSAGGSHTCGRTGGGVTYCWGWNSKGQLGDGTTTWRSVPAPIADLTTFADLSAGGSHTCGITTDREAYCWGDNNYGQLGIGSGDRLPHPSPAPVVGDLEFVSISSGAHSPGSGGSPVTCALTPAGSAYCWGSSSLGELGSDSTTTECYTSTMIPPCVPWPVPVSGGLIFESLSAEDHSCALTYADVAYCWGRNSEGQLGDGTTTDSHTPVLVSGSLAFATVDVAGYHTCGVTTDGVAYCWGLNSSGQLGDGTEQSRYTPVRVVWP
jgi:alpha-tubulin suppressor-like RCC1 family protein